MAWRLVGESAHENTRKSKVFSRVEGVWAPKSEPLGPKSRAKEGPGEAKVASDRRRGQDRKVEPLSRVILSVSQSYGWELVTK